MLQLLTAGIIAHQVPLWSATHSARYSTHERNSRCSTFSMPRALLPVGQHGLSTLGTPAPNAGLIDDVSLVSLSWR